MTLHPLGDQAWQATFADEGAAAAFAAAVRAGAAPWVVDVGQAYRSVAVFFDADAVGLDGSAAWLRERDTSAAGARTPGRRHVIPCCYELQLDLGRVAEQTGRAEEEVIRLHTSCEYTIYAIGFCPG